MRCYQCKNSSWVRSEKDYECERMPKCLMEDVEKREKYNSMNIKVGSKIRFEGEKRFWTVIGRDERFLICIRNWKKTYFYTICDLEECIRGADNYIDSYYDYKELSSEMIEIALAQFHLKEPTSIYKLKISDKAKRYYKEHNYMEPDPQLTEEQRKIFNEEWEKVPNLEISYRHWTYLEIEEVK